MRLDKYIKLTDSQAHYIRLFNDPRNDFSECTTAELIKILQGLADNMVIVKPGEDEE